MTIAGSVADKMLCAWAILGFCLYIFKYLCIIPASPESGVEVAHVPDGVAGHPEHGDDRWLRGRHDAVCLGRGPQRQGRPAHSGRLRALWVVFGPALWAAQFPRRLLQVVVVVVVVVEAVEVVVIVVVVVAAATAATAAAAAAAAVAAAAAAVAAAAVVVVAAAAVVEVAAVAVVVIVVVVVVVAAATATAAAAVAVADAVFVVMTPLFSCSRRTSRSSAADFVGWLVA